MPAWVKKAGFAVLCFVVVATALLHVAYYFPRTVDDLFIYLRYAENFAGGAGLVFNPGERVEGFSSPPWVLLQSLAFFMGFEAVTFTKVLGILSLLSLMAAAGMITLDLTGGSRILALLACLLLALNSYLVSWSIMGLETPLFLSLMFWTVYALMKFKDGAGIGRTAAFVALCFVFALSRPEAPLFLALIFSADVVARRTGRGIMARIKTLAPAVGAAALLLLLFLGARYLYYGELVTHVYYAKEGSGLTPPNLNPLFLNGASVQEIIFAAGGLALLLVFSIYGRLAPLAAVTAAALVFVLLVEEDWMPNLRFFQPAFIAMMLAWLTALAWCLKKIPGRIYAAACGAAIVAVLFIWALQVARVETRYMWAEHNSYGGGETWVVEKSRASFKETMQCMRREIPDSIKRLDIDELGMIHQLFDVLESSDQPLEQSWFVGRDIGRVGYFAPVRIFDTDGLFTRMLSDDELWREHKVISRALAEKTFALHPVAAELLKTWGMTVIESPAIMQEYEAIAGTPGNPRIMKPKRRKLPSTATMLGRYRAGYEKFPKHYFIQTLHGESVGAAMAWRIRHILDVVQDHGPLTVKGVDEGKLEGRGSFPDAGIAAHGCSFDSGSVERGGVVVARCFFEKTRDVDRGYKFFFHFEGPVRFHADHLPMGGLVPTNFWPAGIVRDVVRIKVPKNVPAGKYRLMYGLYTWEERAKAAPPEATDGENRIKGPYLDVL